MKKKDKEEETTTEKNKQDTLQFCAQTGLLCNVTFADRSHAWVRFFVFFSFFRCLWHVHHDIVCPYWSENPKFVFFSSCAWSVNSVFCSFKAGLASRNVHKTCFRDLSFSGLGGGAYDCECVRVPFHRVPAVCCLNVFTHALGTDSACVCIYCDTLYV